MKHSEILEKPGKFVSPTKIGKKCLLFCINEKLYLATCVPILYKCNYNAVFELEHYQLFIK